MAPTIPSITEEAVKRVVQLAKTLDCSLLPYHASQYPNIRTSPHRYLFPTGPFAVGLYHAGDNVHLVCMTDNSASTFWAYIAEKLDREDLPKHDCVVSELSGNGRVWLHYCSTPASFDLATLAGYGFPETRAPTTAMQRTRDRLSDSWHLIKAIKDNAESFREAYWLLTGWAEASGIFSQHEALRLLNSDSLLWMLYHSGASGEEIESSYSHNVRIRPVLERYQNAESLVLRTPSGQIVLDRSPSFSENLDIIASEMKSTLQEPYSFTQESQRRGRQISSIFGQYPIGVTVSAECWAPKKREEFHTALVAELVRFLSAIKTAGFLRGTSSRIWPVPVRQSDDEWIYCILLETWRDNGGDALRGVRPRKQLTHFVESFAFVLDSSQGCANASWNNGLFLSRYMAQLCGSHGWGQQDFLCQATTAHMSSPSNPANPATSFKKRLTASQMLSRLRWDPALAAESYEVGYMDRFEGLMWTPLESWGHATEEEEFIPEHRIRVIRRVGGDEAVVWERKGKVDSDESLIC